MKKFPKPWFRPGRDVWYVTLRGKQINLGPEKDAAFERYKQLLATAPLEPVPSSGAGAGVCELIDKFLDWCQRERKLETYEWYRWRLQSFAETIDRSLAVAHLKPYHLDDFLAKHPGWASGTKHGACRAVQRAMLWAEKKGYIERSPIAHYEKPTPGKRKVVIPPAEFERLLSLVPSQNFRDLLEIAWEAPQCLPTNEPGLEKLVQTTKNGETRADKENPKEYLNCRFPNPAKELHDELLILIGFLAFSFSHKLSLLELNMHVAG